PVTRADLVRRCVAAGGNGADLAGLQQAGVLAADLGLGEQDGDPLPALLRLLPQDCPEELRDVLRALRDAETAFAAAAPQRRSDLLAELRALVATLAGRCGVELPPLEFARTLMYEDSVDPRPVVEPRPRWEAHLDTLAALHRVVPWFDDHAHTRATVAQVVEAMFGPGPHRLLTLYSAMSVPKARNALIARLVDLHAPVPTALRRLQDQVLGQVAPGTPGDTEVVLDPARLRALAGQAPDWVSRWARVSWQVQRHAGEDGAERLVLNSSAIGYGRTISRFCYSFEAADATAARFTETVRRELAEPDDAPVRSADLSAVLGINANIHPALLPRYLCYPCGTPGGWPGTGISLEDCWARVRRGQLELTVGRDGPQLRLVPLNFLLNELAPQFYRFLSFFSTGSLANLGWWDRVDQRQPPSGPGRGVRAYPRVRVGSVVVARRTWKLPPTSLPAVAGQDSLAGYREIRRWQHELGLPDLVFSRQFTLSDPLVPLDPERQRRNARSLVQFPSSAARKPALVDFTSVTSVRAWQRTLGRLDDDLTLQECLPLPGSQLDGGAADGRVREYLLETVGGDDD
ncbi:lantibiotic dehydratase, partial [Micromonospora carbonacea]|uniref:lantibiotic dehydratase n=1 Tax=Micromonospora carbonacea TaxID=47853 RepID=UPI003D73781D